MPVVSDWLRWQHQSTSDTQFHWNTFCIDLPHWSALSLKLLQHEEGNEMKLFWLAVALKHKESNKATVKGNICTENQESSVFRMPTLSSLVASEVLVHWKRSPHDAHYVVICSTVDYHYTNLWCSQWWHSWRLLLLQCILWQYYCSSCRKNFSIHTAQRAIMDFQCFNPLCTDYFWGKCLCAFYIITASWWDTGSWFDMQKSSHQYRKSHCGDIWHS